MQLSADLFRGPNRYKAFAFTGVIVLVLALVIVKVGVAPSCPVHPKHGSGNLAKACQPPDPEKFLSTDELTAVMHQQMRLVGCEPATASTFYRSCSWIGPALEYQGKTQASISVSASLTNQKAHDAAVNTPKGTLRGTVFDKAEGTAVPNVADAKLKLFNNATSNSATVTGIRGKNVFVVKSVENVPQRPDHIDVRATALAVTNALVKTLP